MKMLVSDVVTTTLFLIPTDMVQFILIVLTTSIEFIPGVKTRVTVEAEPVKIKQ